MKKTLVLVLALVCSLLAPAAAHAAHGKAPAKRPVAAGAVDASERAAALKRVAELKSQITALRSDVTANPDLTEGHRYQVLAHVTRFERVTGVYVKRAQRARTDKQLRVLYVHVNRLSAEVTAEGPWAERVAGFDALVAAEHGWPPLSEEWAGKVDAAEAAGAPAEDVAAARAALAELDALASESSALLEEELAYLGRVLGARSKVHGDRAEARLAAAAAAFAAEMTPERAAALAAIDGYAAPAPVEPPAEPAPEPTQ